LKLDALVAVPPGVVTEMGPLVAFFGTVETMASAVSLTMVAAVPLKATAVAPDRFVPVIVTLAPTRPWRRAKAVMVGADVPGARAKMTTSVVVSPTAQQAEVLAHDTPSIC
jgi:hypothetical protein